MTGGAPVVVRDLVFDATPAEVEVSASLVRPSNAHCLYVLAHGAGAGMRHPFFDGVGHELARHRIATFRFQFPYMEAGRRRPDRAPVLEGTVRAAVVAAARAAPDLPLIAGGKSMGGRMASRAASTEPLPGVRGFVFLGFPLHPAGKPATERADHLASIELPMLFLQGTRDRLADLSLLRPIISGLGRRATLHVVPDGDHSFAVLARTRRSESDVMRELSRVIGDWVEREVLRI